MFLLLFATIQIICCAQQILKWIYYWLWLLCGVCCTQYKNIYTYKNVYSNTTIRLIQKTLSQFECSKNWCCVELVAQLSIHCHYAALSTILYVYRVYDKTYCVRTNYLDGASERASEPVMCVCVCDRCRHLFFFLFRTSRSLYCCLFSCTNAWQTRYDVYMAVHYSQSDSDIDCQ